MKLLKFLETTIHHEQYSTCLLRPRDNAMLDSEFIKQRAAHCRVLAEKADPFIKRRLLDLATKYEASFPKQPSQKSINLIAPVMPLATPPDQ
jgi:hypothetical protein